MPISRNKETQLTPTNTGRTEQSTLSIRMETPKYSILYVFKALNAVSGHTTVTLSLHKQKTTFRVLQVKKKELHLQRDEVLTIQNQVSYTSEVCPTLGSVLSLHQNPTKLVISKSKESLTTHITITNTLALQKMNGCPTIGFLYKLVLSSGMLIYEEQNNYILI